MVCNIRDLRWVVATAALALAAACISVSAAAAPPPSTSPPTPEPVLALVLQDQAPLRGAPHDTSAAVAQLWRGEVLELRGERLDQLQVWDHRRERGGFVRSSQVMRIGTRADDAPELLAQLRLVQGMPGAEALGIGLAAAYLQAAPASQLAGPAGGEALLALGRLAERLADRASAGAAASKGAETALSAQLDVAARYGLRFTSHERDGRLQVCYEGDAFRRVLSMAGAAADVDQAERRATAALALTRFDCIDPQSHPGQRERTDTWRAEVLEHIDPRTLRPAWKNRIAMRRAAVFGSLAFARARRSDELAAQAAERAIVELQSVAAGELGDDDQAAWHDAVIRANAARWAAQLAAKPAVPASTSGAGQPSIRTLPGADGETCVVLVDARHPVDSPLARRCSWGIVWTASATLNREANALALAVQPLDGWRELWLFRRTADGWTVGVLPPASATPGTGYAEFAGWVPGGQQVLVARESQAEGRHRHSFELVRLDTLATERQAGDASLLGAFQRWQDPAWKRDTLSLR